MCSSRYDEDKLFVCEHCNLHFKTKVYVKRHILRIHMVKPEDLACSKCKIKFKSKGIFEKHMRKFHKAKRARDINKDKPMHLCYACQIHFATLIDLKFHIREFHFNLLAKVPYLKFKKVNQVWFENVTNSKNIVEIKKVAENTILIRKLDDNTSMKVGEQPTEILDLRDKYPTKRGKTVQCDICFKLYEKMYLNKHKADVHAVLS